MLNYKPSIGQRNGNDTQVSVRDDGTIYGASIGGRIVHVLKKPDFPNNEIDPSLTNTSTWFYKQVTDYNFINGQEYYRALYIGVDPQSDENEILGTIQASVSNTFNSNDSDIQDLVDESVSVEIWSEGKFNFAKSVLDNGGITLEDEIDSTGVLQTVAIWRDEIDINQTLIPGEYFKIWIKITCVKDESLLEYNGYSYNIKVGDLVIPIAKEQGRLNISSVYSVDLNDVTDIDYILTETLPNSFNLAENLKVINKNGYINVFYFNDEDQLNVLTIKPDQNIAENKYINTNLHDLTGVIKEAQDYTYTNFSECITMGSTGSSGTSGTSGSPETQSTTGTSGTSGTSGNPITEVIDGLLDSKFIVDIYVSKKEDFNVFYILYNEFITTTASNYVDRYGHQEYNWNTGVIKVDLRTINDVLFESIDPGETFNMTLIDDSAVFDMQDRHYWNSAVFIDDLFIIAGFDVEDCRLTNNRSGLTYIWEKDIVLNKAHYQQTLIPESERNTLKTVPNRARSEAYLDFSDINEIDTNDTTIERRVKTFSNGVEYVQMGPPHRTGVHHRFSSVTYDIPLRVDSFSATWAFGIDDDCSCIINSTPATGAPSTGGPETPSSTGVGTTGTTGVGTTGTTGTGTTGTSGVTDNPDVILSTSPYLLHMLYQSDYNDYLSSPYSLVNPFDRSFKDTFISIFKLHCNGNTENSAVTVEYNFHENIWKITTEDNKATWINNFVRNGPRLSVDFENVFTLNTWRKQIYGCGKKFMLNFNLYINGTPLFDGISYTESTTDTYVLTHNHDEEFSGHLSYLEVRDGLLLEGNKYSTTMFQILSNISWAEQESHISNTVSPKGLEFYSFKSSFILNNLNWDNDDDFLFPIVLQGNSYNLNSDYNSEIRRTVFDFNKVNVNDPSFAFTFEGTSKILDWQAEPYDFNNDIMVVWVRLRDWRGQRLNMYYGDIRVIRDESINKVYDGYYGFWPMNKFQNQAQVRFDNNQIYDGGEAIVVATNKNGTFTLQLDKQYMFGNQRLYKSNQFDIAYDDRDIHRNREESVNEFITDSVELFKPGTMFLRNIKGLYPLKIESNGVGGENQ